MSTHYLVRYFFSVTLLFLLVSCLPELPENPGDNPSLWLSKPGGIFRVDAQTGELQLQVPDSKGAHDFILDESRQVLWVVYTRVLKRYSLDGSLLSETILPAQFHYSSTLALNNDGSIWHGRDNSLQRYSADGHLIDEYFMGHPLSDFVIDPATGDLWVLSKRLASTDVVLHFDQLANELASMVLSPGEKALSIRWDPRLDMLWLSTSRRLLAVNGEMQVQVDLAKGGLTMVEPDKGEGLWASDGKDLYRFSDSGEWQWTQSAKKLSGFPLILDLAADEQEEHIWLAGINSLVKVDSMQEPVTKFRQHYYSHFGLVKKLLFQSRDLPAELTIAEPLQDDFINDNLVDIILHFVSSEEVDLSSLDFMVNDEAWDFSCSVLEQGDINNHDSGTQIIRCQPSFALPEGMLVLQATVTDHGGNQLTAEPVIFTLDTKAPTLVLDQPEDGLWTNQFPLLLAGSVNETGSLLLNGEALSAGADGRFEYELLLIQGENSFTLVATDLAGNQTVLTRKVYFKDNPPDILDENRFSYEWQFDGGLLIRGEAGAAEPFSRLLLHNVTRNEQLIIDVAEDGSFNGELLASEGDELVFTVQDRAGNTSPGLSQQVPEKGIIIAPDPSIFAPLQDRSVVTDFSSATAFIHSGATPLQQDVEPDAIEDYRVAVVRGRVQDRTGQALSGVRISAHKQPQLGYTYSRADGYFDLAVNGGGLIVVQYEKEGYLPVQRKVRAPWQDYVAMDDVVMIVLDSQVTPVNFSGTNNTIQMASGSLVSDSDGQRQAMVMFPAGTQASMVLQDGSTQVLDSGAFRATEYTVGENGKEAMPGELPASSGYTYAVELSLDEAIAAKARSVQFDRPVYLYVENFLDFPVGGVVPVGWYDTDQAAWVPSDNGVIIQILTIENGLAVLDVDGSGLAADDLALQALDITDEERATLATRYSPGQSLWRSPVEHFTSFDCNWPVGPPEDAGEAPDPEENMPETDDKEEKPDCRNGSIIQCQNQVLGQRIPVTGTPFSLYYSSDRVLGRRAAYSVDIPLSGDIVPPSLKRIDLQVDIAGQRFTESFPAEPGQRFVFEWDGRDVYGRLVQGKVYAKVVTSYVYDGVYRMPDRVKRSFARRGVAPLMPQKLPDPRVEVSKRRTSYRLLGLVDMSAQQMGAWSLDPHHLFEPDAATLWQGNGFQLGVEKRGQTIETVLDDPNAREVTIGPDGVIYTGGRRHIYRIDRDGAVTIVAGTGQAGFSGDGGPATAAQIRSARALTLDQDGNLYFVDIGNHRIRKIDNNGLISTIAGTGVAGSEGDGGPAINAEVYSPWAMVADSHGGLYFADALGNRVRYIDAEGIVSTIAGTGEWTTISGGDGKPAIEARLFGPRGLALNNEGELYIAEYNGHRVRKIGFDGIIQTVAGGGNIGFRASDGHFASDVRVSYPRALTFGPDGSLYIGEEGYSSIRRVSAGGVISRIAGTGAQRSSGDGGLAVNAELAFTTSMAFSQEGELYTAGGFTNDIRLRRINSIVGDVVSEDGLQVYRFNVLGRHLETVDSVTGVQRYRFDYDENDRLVAISDRDDNVTTIERGSNGVAQAITSPNGQRTELTYDSHGYLASLANPAGDTWQMAYSEDGLLSSFTKPSGSTSIYNYDEKGRLIQSRNAFGGGWDLSRSEQGRNYVASMTSMEGRSTHYAVDENFFNFDGVSWFSKTRTNTYPDGSVSMVQELDNESVLHTSRDGTVRQSFYAPDPRFGMVAKVPREQRVLTPSGRLQVTTRERNASLDDSQDVLSHTELTETVSVNGRSISDHYISADRSRLLTSAEGRHSLLFYNEQGRPQLSQFADLAASQFHYDSRGRISEITQGEGSTMRNTQFSYDALGNLAEVEDALGRSISMDYDLAGRVIQQTLPDGKQVQFQYDTNGNLTSLTPPGKSAHLFHYNAIDQESAYNPPALNGVQTNTHYTYNLDRELTRIDRPDGQALQFHYNSGGQLESMSMDYGTYGYSYHSSTGKLVGIAAPDNVTLNYNHDGFLLTDTQWSGVINGAVSMDYDNNFWLTELCINTTHCVNLAYDNDGLLTQAGDMTLTRNSSNGLLESTSLHNTDSTYAYNSFGELIASSVVIAGTDPESSAIAFNYVRDNLGRITQKTESINGQNIIETYQYDVAGRLISATRNGNTTNYGYDSNGNRITENGNTIASYDEQDRLTSYSNCSYSYTQNGELLQKVCDSGTTSYNYDVIGNLRSAVIPDSDPESSVAIDYLIDGQNRRVGKRVNGTLTQGFLYQDQLNPVAELDANGNIVSRFVYGTKPHVPDYLIKDGNTYKIISDHLGSVRLVVNASTGQVAQQITYDVWGNITQDTNPGFQPFAFAGGLYDQHTKLTRFGARDYDAQTGRWTIKDPIRFDGGDTNLYGYVLNDPVNFIDPEGLAVSCEQKLRACRAAGQRRMFAGAANLVICEERYGALSDCKDEKDSDEDDEDDGDKVCEKAR